MVFSLALFALAAAPVDAGHEAKILGWSKDGRYVVWTHQATAERVKRHYFQTVKGKRVEVKDPRKLPEAERAGLKEHHEENIDAPAEMEDTERVEVATVYDVQHEEKQVFVMKAEELVYEGGHALADSYRSKSAGDPAAFEAWKKDHPIVGKAHRLGPNGAKADIQVKGADDAKWSGEALSWSVDNEATVTFVTSVNKLPQKLALQEHMEAMYAPRYTATVWWDPTGRRAMFVLDQHDSKTMRSLETFTVSLYFLGGGTAVELLATQDVQPSVLKAVDAIEGAGFAVISRGEAQKARPSTVVYADDKHQAEAQKIAAAIPGGATVDKLSWKANGDVVVALGASAK